MLYWTVLFLISEVSLSLTAPTPPLTQTTATTKRKPLPFEDEFDSEYDYISEEYDDYLTLNDIENAVIRHSQKSRTKRSIEESNRHYHLSTAATTPPSFNFNNGQFDDGASVVRHCNPPLSTCNSRKHVILVLPDDRRVNPSPDGAAPSAEEDDEYKCRKKKCKKRRKHHHRHRDSNQSDDDSEDSKERKRRLKEMKRNRHHPQGDHAHHDHRRIRNGSGANGSEKSNGSDNSGKNSKRRKHHRHHHHHHNHHHNHHHDEHPNKKEDDLPSQGITRDCFHIHRHHNHDDRHRSGEQSIPCQSGVFGTLSTTTERSYDIDIRAGF